MGVANAVDMQSILSPYNGSFTPVDAMRNSANYAAEGKVITADGQVKAAPGVLIAVIASFDGATAGDTIEFIDSLTSTGTSKLTIVAQAADENVVFTPAVGIKFATGIFYDETLSGGDVTVTAVYA